MFYNNLEDRGFIKSSRRGVFLLLLSFFYALNANAQQDTLKEKNYSLEFQVFANAGFNDEPSLSLKSECGFIRTLI